MINRSENNITKMKSGFKFNSDQKVNVSSEINFEDAKVKKIKSLNVNQLNIQFNEFINNEEWNNVFQYYELYGCKFVVSDLKQLRNLIKNIISQCESIQTINLNWIDVSNINNMSYLFYFMHECNVDISKWDVSNVTDMSQMFDNANFNGDISKWDVSNVINMSGMFQHSQFNRDISKWDVSSVKNMARMFYESSFNGNISAWNVSNVKNMGYMFVSSNFNNDISKWKISNDCDITSMFTNCNIDDKYKPKMLQNKINENTTSGFKFSSNQVDNSTYINFEDSKIHNVESLNWTKLHNDFKEAIKKGDKDKANSYLQFYGDILLYDFPFDCKVDTKEELRNIGKFFDDSKYDNFDLNNIDISSITDMSFVFNRLTYFNCKIDKWDVSHVINMNNMFGGYHIDEDYESCEKYFNQPLNDWDVSNVKNMTCMFEGCTYFDQPLNNWNVSNVIHTEGMFKKCKNFNQNINNWDVSSVIDMTSMFEDCEMFNSPLNSWDVSNVRDMSVMFYGAVLFNQPLNKWNVSNVESMSYMFGVSNDNVGADVNIAYFNQNINDWDVSNVFDMGGMFINCRFFNQPLDKWANKLEKLENVAYMFSNCNSFCQDLSSWNLKNILWKKNDMFKRCDKLPRKFYPKGV